MASDFDIIVIGGGHAGAEAAHAAARLGARTALVTMQLDAIGRMSCNPAIGGLGKGHMVCEIDALGGLMGRATDATGIQFRLLNRSKGPAVRAPRAQADRERYAAELHRLLAETPAVTLIEGIVDEILSQELATPRSDETAQQRAICGVQLADGRALRAARVIITSGTFMRGLMHCGTDQRAGGRVGEQAAVGLSACLERLGLRLGRLKTGTPPRIHRDTVDFARLERQPGDDEPYLFSALSERPALPQVDCWITHTNPAVHALIRDNLHVAPMYSGQIASRGPRYCPSIEDKVVRFAEKSQHQIFLEPEGLDSPRIYCNGISTSLPAEIQQRMLAQIVGLERAEILQPGYAVEYDWVPTEQIDATLQTKAIPGLYLAGQINGTSGYEEAAGQGLLAGINAALTLRGEEPLVLGRNDAYIGVMIDDIVTRPPDEPYRMFTSRAEYRMTLRCDNADERLTPIGRRIGLVDHARWARFETDAAQRTTAHALLSTTRVNGSSAADHLRRPEVRLTDLIQDLSDLQLLRHTRPRNLARVETAIKYDGYIERQERQIARFQSLENKRIPAGFDFAAVDGLRHEAREKLSALAPRSLGQAARISGISPADITVLWVALERRVRASRSIIP